jgi:hypothetical protein
MRTYRSVLLSIGGIALCASMLTLGSATLPTAALACPGEAHAGEGKCDCGKDKADCEAAKADGSCGGCEHGKAAAKDGKACACAPGEDGKCACGAECPSNHGGKCAKDAAATPAGDEHKGCDHGKGEGASAAPRGGSGLVAVIDPATGELSGPTGGSQGASVASANAPATGAKAASEVGGGAGTMAEFPESRVSHAVARVDADGNLNVGCERPAR